MLTKPLFLYFESTCGNKARDFPFKRLSFDAELALLKARVKSKMSWLMCLIKSPLADKFLKILSK